MLLTIPYFAPDRSFLLALSRQLSLLTPYFGCLVVDFRNPEIPIEQLRRDSSPPIANPPTQVGGDHAPALPAGWEQQMSASKGKAYYVHTETGRTTWVHPAKEIVDNRAYRPSHASMQEGSSNFVSDREAVYKSYASQGRPSPALSGPTQESAWSDMKRMWAEGDWRNQLPVNFGKQARQMVMTEFQDEAQSKAAHQLVGKIDDHELEVQINAEILNHGFDLNAWLCLKQVGPRFHISFHNIKRTHALAARCYALDPFHCFVNCAGEICYH